MPTARARGGERPNSLGRSPPPIPRRHPGRRRWRPGSDRSPAKLTLLDEATSALDPENSRLVLDAARLLAEHGSVVVIAHNLETIRGADRILVLDRGRLVQQGTHAELERVPGLYRDLVAIAS